MIPDNKSDVRDGNQYTRKGKSTEGVYDYPDKEKETEYKVRVVM